MDQWQIWWVRCTPLLPLRSILSTSCHESRLFFAHSWWVWCISPALMYTSACREVKKRRTRLLLSSSHAWLILNCCLAAVLFSTFSMCEGEQFPALLLYYAYVGVNIKQDCLNSYSIIGRLDCTFLVVHTHFLWCILNTFCLRLGQVKHWSRNTVSKVLWTNQIYACSIYLNCYRT